MSDQSVRAVAKAPLIVLAAVAGSALVSACADTKGGPIPYSETFSAPDAPTIVPLESSYKIAPLDTITVKVFKMPDLSGDYEVDLTGQISMPLIGEVPAVDLTTAELDRRLTDKLGERYLENPDVSVGIKASTRRSVTVDGAVNKAGSYPITDRYFDAGRRQRRRHSPETMPAGRGLTGRSAASARRPHSTRRHPPRQSEDPAVYRVTSSSWTARRSRPPQKHILNSLRSSRYSGRSELPRGVRSKQ